MRAPGTPRRTRTGRSKASCLPRLVRILALLAGSALTGAEPAAAAEPAPLIASASEPPLGVPPGPAGAPFRLRIGIESAPNAGFGGADVSWLRSGAHLGVGGPVSKRVELNLQLAGEVVAFDVDGDESFLSAGRPGAPFDDLIKSSVRLGAGFHVREKWLLVGEGYLQASLERGADVGDALRGGVVLGVGYRRSTKLEALLGVGLGKRFDRAGLHASPTLRVRWQIDDRWRLDLNNAEVQVERELSEHWTVSFAAAFEEDRFRLSDRDDGPGGVGEGSLAHSRVPITLGVEWQPRVRWNVRVRAGSVAWQRFKVKDEDANGFDSATSDRAAPFASLDVTARF